MDFYNKVLCHQHFEYFYCRNFEPCSWRKLTFPTSVVPLFVLSLGDCNKLSAFIFCCKAGLQRFCMNLLSSYSTIKLHVTDVSGKFSVSVFSIMMDAACFFFTLLTLSDPTSDLVRQYNFPVLLRCRKRSDTVFVAFVRPLSEPVRRFFYVVRTLANR
jgi:hypothetical protein